MNGLRLALAIMGTLVVFIVVLASYDRVRLKKILKRKSYLQRGRRYEPALAYHSEFDFKGTLPTDSDKPVLEATVEESAPEERGDDFDAALEELEHAAVMQLDLDPGLPADIQEQRPDETVDFVARIHGRNVVAHDKVLGIYRQHEYLLDRHHRIFGFNVARGVWRDLEADDSADEYHDLELSLQLSDGNGPADESALNKLAQLSLKIADAIERPLKFSMTFEEAQDKAVALDDTCHRFDVLAIMNVIARDSEGFPGSAIQQSARQQGLRFGAMNIFHKRNRGSQGGPYPFSLANLYKPGEFNLSNFAQFSTRGLTLFMNIPGAHRPVQVFREMAECGIALCASLGGKLMDRDNRKLDTAALSRIEQQIETIAADMEKAGIRPGSDTALRLF